MVFKFPGILTVCLALTFAQGLLGAQKPNSRVWPFAPGETLTYDVTWSIFPAGQVVATLKQLGQGPDDSYEIDTTARSNGFVSLLYDVDDHYRAIFNPRTLCSSQIFKTINEGRRHKKTQIVFDAAKKVAILHEVDLANPSHPVKVAQNPIPPCVEDIITSFYYLRTRPMHVGEKIELPVNDGSKTQEVVANVQARVRLKTALGTRWAFRVEPSTLGNLFKRKGRLTIWFSDDFERLPLRIRAVLLIGAITGNLASVSHEGHPLSGP